MPDIAPDASTGRKVSPRERMRQVIEIAKIADEGGLNIIGVGEHHSLKFVNSATATISSPTLTEHAKRLA